MVSNYPKLHLSPTCKLVTIPLTTESFSPSAIFLWMISRTQLQLSTESFLQPRPKLRHRPQISIRHNTRRDTMQTHDLLDIQLCQPFHRIIHSYRNKMSRF